MGVSYCFRTRHKSFSFKLNEFGSELIIQESSIGRSFTISLEAEGCKWLASQLLQIMGNRPNKEVLRTFRKGIYRLCLFRGENKAGEFLRLMKVENGKVKTLMIPKEKDGAGWSNFYVYVKSFFIADNQREKNLGRLSKIGVTREEEKSDSEKFKDWRKAITVYRSNTKMSWKEISRKLEAIIKRKPEVNQVAADRAIFWCFGGEELNGLLFKPEQLSSHNTYVKMDNWKKEDHWENLQIGVRYGWIGIEGLPLQMWNIHVFKVIGEACGGLLEVAEETLKKSYLGFAKIKIKGFESGLMNPIIEILCQGEKVCLGAFSISGPKGGVRGYRSAGVTTRKINRMISEVTTSTDGVIFETRVVKRSRCNDDRGGEAGKQAFTAGNWSRDANGFVRKQKALLQARERTAEPVVEDDDVAAYVTIVTCQVT